MSQAVIRITLGLAIVIAAMTLTTPLMANTVTITNSRGAKIKLCTYRSDDKSVIRPRKCWMLKKDQAAKWDRGTDESDFDVRIFGPGVFELPICLKRNLSNASQIIIVAASTRACVQTTERVSVPEQTWTEGSAVLVNRSDDEYWYPAVIIGQRENGYNVVYRNGYRAIVTAKYITDDTLRPGMRAEVKWKNQGRWYPVRIASRKPDKITVTYEDGKTEQADLALIRVGSNDLMKLDQP